MDTYDDPSSSATPGDGFLLSGGHDVKDIESGIPMRRDVWIFLFVLGVLFFSWPIMSIFENSLVSSLFVIWLVFIACIFITSIFSEREDGGG